MKIQIKSIAGSVLFEGDFSSVAKCLEAAVAATANLADAYLADAYLATANLADAYLARANLARANLAGANLATANLAGANLAGANLAGANLADAYLADAYLAGANLADAKGAEWAIAQTRILPAGDIIVWKKLRDSKIAKLLIPEDAKRSHAFGRKCRAEWAKVLEIYDGKKTCKSGLAHYDGKTEYITGKTVRPDKWNENWQDECAGGIHFFITRDEAEAYPL